ncbi:MAG: dipeptidase [Hyphomonadaceae bacterium]|nr:dipeptidase [Clostridia bacterium]
MIFDAHCDTLTALVDDNYDLYQNSGHFDIHRAMQLGGHVQIFAAWVEPNCQNPFTRTVQKIEVVYKQISAYKDYICHVCNDEALQNVLKDKRIAAILSIEGGEALNGNIENLTYFYNKGVRMLGLTWNGHNEIADGVGVLAPAGLSIFGKALVQRMNALGMVIDLSHIAKTGFWDVLELTSRPVAVSHSNSFSICSHVRNLSDQQFKAIVKNGGVVGVNFYTPFLSTDKMACIDDIFKHIEHFLSLGGENHIGFGADFDGMAQLPQGISGVEHYERLVNEMVKRNYKIQLIDKITHGNFMRLMQFNL